MTLFSRRFVSHLYGHVNVVVYFLYVLCSFIVGNPSRMGRGGGGGRQSEVHGHNSMQLFSCCPQKKKTFISSLRLSLMIAISSFQIGLEIRIEIGIDSYDMYLLND